MLFGSTCLSCLPVSELVESLGLNISVCNRSIAYTKVADAVPLLDTCIFDLQPRKVFLNFGETDLDAQGFDEDSFIISYHRLISSIRDRLKYEIYIVSIV